MNRRRDKEQGVSWLHLPDTILDRDRDEGNLDLLGVSIGRVNLPMQPLDNIVELACPLIVSPCLIIWFGSAQSPCPLHSSSGSSLIAAS